MKDETVIVVVAMLCLTILGVAAKVVTPEASEVFYTIVVAVAGLAGWAIPRAIQKARAKK